MRRVVVVVVVVARDVVAVPHARCPRVHRAWTRAEVASAIAVRVAVCRVESNRIESDKPLAGVFVGGAGETRDAGREGTDATKEAEDERPIGSSMTNVTLDVTRKISKRIEEIVRINARLLYLNFPRMIVKERVVTFPHMRAKRGSSAARPCEKKLVVFN